MARELGPQGMHMGFVNIDGQIESERYRNLIDERGEDSLFAPDAIAETYLHPHPHPPRTCIGNRAAPGLMKSICARGRKDSSAPACLKQGDG